MQGGSGALLQDPAREPAAHCHPVAATGGARRQADGGGVAPTARRGGVRGGDVGVERGGRVGDERALRRGRRGARGRALGAAGRVREGQGETGDRVGVRGGGRRPGASVGVVGGGRHRGTGRVQVPGAAGYAAKLRHGGGQGGYVVDDRVVVWPTVEPPAAAAARGGGGRRLHVQSLRRLPVGRRRGRRIPGAAAQDCGRARPDRPRRL